MPFPVNKSKLRGERSKLFFDFADILDFGEILSTWNVTATVITGIDAQPDDMVFLLQQTTDTVAIQYVVLGEPGVIYEFRCEALTSFGRTLVKEQTLAVLPSVSLFPPLFGVPRTTPPYPLEVLDGCESSGAVTGGQLKVLFVFLTMPTLALETAPSFLSGTLRAPLISYSFRPEAIEQTPLMLSGTLRTILIQYSFRPEAVEQTSAFINGTLRAILISNSMWPEAVEQTPSFTGGTLV